MTLLQNYLYRYIIKCILEFIYNKTNGLKNHYYLNGYEIPNNYNNHAIDLSLVCKKWFQFVQDILLNELLNFKNYKVLKKLIQDCTGGCCINNNSGYGSICRYGGSAYDFGCDSLNNNTNSNNSNSNNKYKLIKYKNSVMVFNSLKDYFKFRKIISNNINNNNSCNNILIGFKNILIKSKTHSESIIILKDLNKFPPNCVFNFRLSTSKNDETFNVIGDIINSKSRIKVNKIKLSGVLLCSDGIGNESFFKNILKLDPVSVSYTPDISCFEDGNVDISIFFSDFNDSKLEHFKNFNNVEPIDLSRLSLKSKLKSITVPIAFHQIIKALHLNKYCNGKSIETVDEDQDEDEDYCEVCTTRFYGFRNQMSIESDWNLMVKAISSNSNLKELSLFNSCGDSYDCIDQHYDTSLINNGLSDIVNNPKCNIEILTLQGYGFLDSTFIKALSLNQSIRTLILIHSLEDLIFNRILNGSNRYIKNVIIESNENPFKLLELLINLNNLELYSITFMNVSIKSLNKSLKMLSSSSSSTQFNIKEINFYLFESLSASANNNRLNNNKTASVNNIFINIFYKSNDKLDFSESSDDSDISNY